MKVVCPFCENINEVKKGSDVVNCQACGSSFTIEDGQSYTVKKYKELQSRGYLTLHRTQNFEECIECYSYCLELKKDDLTSIMGICLAETSMSTFLETRFYRVKEIIEEHEVYLNVENTLLFLSFIKDLMDQINFYLLENDSRVKTDDTFINVDYFKEYVKTLLDIKDLLSYLNDSFEIMNQDELNMYKAEEPEFIEKFNSLKDRIHQRLNETCNVNHLGDIKLNEGKYSLEEEKVNVKDLEIDQISDINLVRVNKKAFTYQKIFMPLTIGLGLIGIILMFVYAGTQNLGCLISGGVLVVLAIISYILFRVLVKRLFKD